MTTINLATLQDMKSNNAITLVEVLGLLWKKRCLLLVFILLGAAVGVFMGNWIRPQYSSDALLKLDVKGNKAGKAMGEMGMLLDMASPADAEIEMIKSRMVLSYVVDAEGLCFSAVPMGFIDRILHHEGRMDLSNLVLPQENRTGWTARIVSDSTYQMISPDGIAVLQGKVGVEIGTIFKGDSIAIQVGKLKGEPGQQFKLGRTTPLKAARRLAGQLRVAERGKQTGVIGVSYSHRYPDRAQSVLNSVANVYLRQNIEMRSAEAEKTLQFLEQQLPGVKAKLDSAEKNLADYRHRIGSVDMSGETQAMLKKEQDLNMQILSLEQKRQEATRLFKAEHPTVQTITRQLAKLRGELSKLKTSAKKMPLTQQEVLTLQEDVALNNAQYTSMLNNIQQLRVIRAGEVGTVRVVDYAVEDTEQTKPKKSRILLCSVAAFFMVGVLLVFLMRMLRNGLRNALEIERETGVSVYAKIPESKNRMLRSKKRGNLPLVCASPEDPASEALRSLFTAVEFSATAEKPVVMVAGLVAGVGKSFIAKNLAALFANSGKKTLLVDADMRRGVVYSKHHEGLADILAGKSTLEECVSSSSLERLSVLSAGNVRLVAPTDLLHGEGLENLLKKAREIYDVVVVDTPPINLVADTELILPLVDFSLYVLHYGRHSVDQIKEAMSKVDRLSEAPKAFVMNHCEREGGLAYYYGGYYYGYKKRG